jgi:hypothetical protein
VAVLAALMGLAEARGAHAQGATRTWILSASFRQAHNSNLFPFLENGPGDVIWSPSVSVSYLRVEPTTLLNVRGYVYAWRFGEQNQYDRLGATFSLGGSHRFSRRVRSGFSLWRTSSLDAESLYLTRTLFPQIQTSSKGGTGHLSYDLGRTTIATVDLSAVLSHYDTSVPVPALTLDPTLLPSASFPGLTEPTLPGPIGPIDPAQFALGILSTEGLGAGATDFRLLSTGFGLTHKFSPVLTGDGWFGYSNVGITSTTNQFSLPFQGGRTDFRGSLSRQFDPSTRLSFSYSGERNAARVPEVTNQAFVVQVVRAVNEKYQLDASFGYAVLSSSISNLGGTVVGGLGVTIRRKTNNLRFRFDRTTYLAYGVGRDQVANVGGLTLDRALSRRLSTYVFGRFRSSDDPLDPTFYVSLQTYGAGMSYRFRELTHVGTDYTLIRTARGRADAPIDSSVWSVYLSYGKSFR